MPQPPATPSLGITVMPEWFQCEGVEAVLDRLAAVGATAIATSPYLLEPVAAGDGAREPPADGEAGLVRPLDRPLWGLRETWIRSSPCYSHDFTRYAGLRYQPTPPTALTLSQPGLMDDVIEQASRRGIGVYLQVMAASPPGYRVQFSGSVEEDQCRGPDGLLHTSRVDRNASLASPHVVAYCARLVAEMAQRYPGAVGIRLDWPEYPPYDLRSALFDFSTHARPLLRDAGVDAAAFARDLLVRLARWQGAARGAAPHSAPAVREALREAGWDAFFAADGTGAPLWASKRAAVSNLLRSCRAALDALPGARRRFEPQIFPHPLNTISGFPLDQLDGIADAVGVKLYTMHWAMIARYWARDLVGAVPSAELHAVTAAMADFFGFTDGMAPDGSVLAYPEPQQPHPVGRAAQADKIQQARRMAGTVPVIAYAHSYGPVDDVVARARLAAQTVVAPGGSGRLWINRYGYLSDEKLARLGGIWQSPP